MFEISGKFHATARVSWRSSLGQPTLPKGWTARLLFLDLEGQTIVCRPLLDYLIANMHRSDAWQASVVRSLGLYWDYSTALRSLGRAPRDPNEAFRCYASALLQGTIDGLADPLGLFWIGQPIVTVRRLLSSLEDFVNSKQAGTVLEASLRGTPVLSGQMNRVRRRFSLLGYLDDSAQRHPRVDGVLPQEKFGTSLTAPLSFPPHKVEEVLWRGFILPGKSGSEWGDYNIGAMMIYLLQGFAGAREHEPFHLWVNDVVENPANPGQALVYLYHPSQGAAYLDAGGRRGAKTTRAQKLALEYNLPVRTHGVGAYRIGWKSSKVDTDDRFAVFHWSDPTAAHLFLLLYRRYLPYREALISKRLALGYSRHPFLFVSGREARNRADGAKYLAAPASIESYDTALERAVVGCGLTFGKSYGTTSHGLRHLYAYTLRQLGAGTKVLQEALRHKNPFSSDRYGVPGPSAIARSLDEANSRARNDEIPATRLTGTQRWLDGLEEDYRNAII